MHKNRVMLVGFKRGGKEGVIGETMTRGGRDTKRTGTRKDLVWWDSP